MSSQIPDNNALSLYEQTICTDSGQYFCNARQFVLPVSGNAVEIVHCGATYFSKAAAAMRTATNFIWIADWQMAFDVELDQRGHDEHPGRVLKIIEDVIQRRPVQIKVLLYKSVTDGTVGTYERLVSSTLNAINKPHFPGRVEVVLQGPTAAQRDFYEYSHHQKFIVVDGQVAFIGGLDLTHGRYETPEYDVVINPKNYVLNEMRNPCVPNIRPVSANEDEKLGIGFAKPYAGALLEEGCQPRMPWQDVQIQLRGPAVVDIHRNFVRRWNIAANEKGIFSFFGSKPPQRIDRDWLKKHGAYERLEKAYSTRVGSSIVQIVRAVSKEHLEKESKTFGSHAMPDDLDLYDNPRERELFSRCIKKWCDDHQANILNAMVNCIRSADNYIYIETQFFVSSYGNVEMKERKNGRVVYKTIYGNTLGNEGGGIQNLIVKELADRIIQHIYSPSPSNFHVYLVLPVHPEGAIDDSSVWRQQWQAQSAILHGTESLVKKVQAALKSRKRPEEDWKKYLTVLNLRSYGAAVQYARVANTMNEDFNQEIGRYVITEQIYVHSKIMIVDDAVAIVGSANVNDRSLTGNGDTEIAAVVVDTAGVKLEDLGSPLFKVQTRKFARELRRSLWEKHFGVALDQNNYFKSTDRAKGTSVVPPLHPPRLKTADDARFFNVTGRVRTWKGILDQPCHPKTVEAIQNIAEHNAQAYETVFQHTPRDSMDCYDDILKFHTLDYSFLRRTDLELYPTHQQRIWALQREQKMRVPASASASASALSVVRGVVPPALQPAYMTKQLMPHQKRNLHPPAGQERNRYLTYEGGMVHDVDKAIKYLRDEVVGFFVSVPLEWGRKGLVSGSVDKKLTVDIARAPVDKSKGLA